MAERTTKRADARENEARILEVAMAALLEEPGVSLNAIAKRAGVGIGTLYRHFPSREALLVALYQSELQQLIGVADELLATKSPWDALVGWLDRFAHYGRAKVGLADVLASISSHDRLTQDSYKPIIGALSTLLDANEAAGTIRPDVDPDDLLLMLGFLWRVTPDAAGRTQADRLLKLVLEGLRPPAPVRRERRTRGH
jgi:AcrR family transcriptional regulator